MEAIDKFYSEPENLPIPIVHALSIHRNNGRGRMGEEEIQMRVVEYRKQQQRSNWPLRGAKSGRKEERMPIPNDAVTVEATDPQLGQPETPTMIVTTIINHSNHEQSLDDAIGTWLYEGECGRAYADFRLFHREEDLILRLPNDAITPGMGLVILPDPDAEPGEAFILRQVLLEDAWMGAARMGVRIYLTPAK